MTTKSKRAKKALSPLVRVGVPPEDYNAVVEKAELASVNLHNLVMSATPLVSEEPRALNFGSGELTEFAFGEDVAVASVRFTAEVLAADEKEFAVEATYAVIYAGVRGLSEAAVRLYCKRVGILACYPYFRAMVAQLSWASDIPLPPLPVIRGSRSVRESELPPAPKQDASTQADAEPVSDSVDIDSSKPRRRRSSAAR